MVSIVNSKYSLLTVDSVVPTATLSDAHEPLAPATFWVLITGTSPAPAAADAVTPAPVDVGNGLVALLPVKKFHVASGWFGVHAGAVGAVVTVSVAVPVLPVSNVSMNR